MDLTAGVSVLLSGTGSATGTVRGRGTKESLLEEEKGMVSKNVTSAET